MQRRVQRGDVSRYRKTLETNGSHVSRVHVLTKQRDPTVAHGRIEIDGRNLGGGIDARDDPRVVWRQNLASRGPVRLEAIVRRWVVRGGDHHAGLTAFGDHRERQLGRGTRLGKEEDLEAVRRQHARRPPRELTRPMPRIKRDSRTRPVCSLPSAGRVREGGGLLLTPTLHVDRQAVSRLRDGPVIDCGGTEIAHRPASPAGPKRNPFPEEAVQFGKVLALDEIDESLAILGVMRFGQPATEIVSRLAREQACPHSRFDRGKNRLLGSIRHHVSLASWKSGFS